MDEVKMVIDELIKREYTYEEYLQGDPDNIDMWTNKKRQISASLRILDIANKYGIDRAIATLTAAQPLGDAAVPVLEAAGKCDGPRAVTKLNDLFAYLSIHGFTEADQDIVAAMNVLNALPEEK